MEKPELIQYSGRVETFLTACADDAYARITEIGSRTQKTLQDYIDLQAAKTCYLIISEALVDFLST